MHYTGRLNPSQALFQKVHRNISGKKEAVYDLPTDEKVIHSLRGASGGFLTEEPTTLLPRGVSPL